MDQLLTLKEIGVRLNVKERTVRGWVRLGKLKAIRPGQSFVFRVKESEVLRFMAQEDWEPEQIVPYIRAKLPGMYDKTGV